MFWCIEPRVYSTMLQSTQCMDYRRSVCATFVTVNTAAIKPQSWALHVRRSRMHVSVRPAITQPMTENYETFTRVDCIMH
jgi:hypothetical protein